MTYNLFTQEAGCDNDTNNKYSGRVSGHSVHVWTSLQIAWEMLEKDWISSTAIVFYK